MRAGVTEHDALMLPDHLDQPDAYRAPIAIDGADLEVLIEQLRAMLVIRKAEEKIGDMVTAGKIRCPAHLGIGQEAIAVGVSSPLRASDRVFGAHRSHSHFLALGGSVDGLFAEVLGRVTGSSKGMGGSMHLFDQTVGFLGSVPIVGASVPVATGAGLAAKMDGRGDVAVSYFGDGAMEEGALHESLNLAMALQLPVIFVCENNFFASHLHISLRQPGNSLARFARAHGMPAYALDGNDVRAMTLTAEEAVRRARTGGGPSFIEAVTYRWRGHVGPREDMDVGVRRGDDLVIWKQRDPVGRLVGALAARGWFSHDAAAALDREVQDEIDAAWQRAEAAPFPETAALLDLVYALPGGGTR
jgi:TPP-dependent pyruvate/acetoin dehydrogenase alpha subunit